MLGEGAELEVVGDRGSGAHGQRRYRPSSPGQQLGDAPVGIAATRSEMHVLMEIEGIDVASYHSNDMGESVRTGWSAIFSGSRSDGLPDRTPVSRYYS